MLSITVYIINLNIGNCYEMVHSTRGSESAYSRTYKSFWGRLFVRIYKVNNNSIIFGYSKIGEQVNEIVALIEINQVKIVCI